MKEFIVKKIMFEIKIPEKEYVGCYTNYYVNCDGDVISACEDEDEEGDLGWDVERMGGVVKVKKLKQNRQKKK